MCAHRALDGRTCVPYKIYLCRDGHVMVGGRYRAQGPKCEESRLGKAPLEVLY